jgi:hypothetical protein
MSWTSAEERVNKSDLQDGLWVKLPNDGDSVVVVFKGEPHVREVHWDGKTYVDGPGPDGKASLKISSNVVIGSEMKIIEVNKSTFKDILKVRAKYGLDNWSFEIKRHGEAGNAKTTYSILPETQLTAAQKAEIDRLPLHDLASVYAKKTETGGKEDFNSYKGKDANGAAQAPTPAPQPQAPAPALVDETTANAMIATLKSQPKETVKQFLDKFSIGKVRELRAADVPAAQQFLNALAGTAEEDPFA